MKKYPEYFDRMRLLMIKNKRTARHFCIINVAITALVLASAFPSFAQNGGYAGSYTRMGFGPRGMAMGNAMTSVEDEGIYGHYNPALAAGINDNQIDISAAAMTFNRSLNALNVTFKLPPDAGLNVGILNAGVGSIDGRSNSGYHTENFSTREYQFFTDFGIRLTTKLQAGIGIKFSYANYSNSVPGALGTGFDVGILYRPTSRLAIGVALQDMLSYYRWDTQKLYNTSGSLQTKDKFPTRIKIGLSYRFLNNKLLLATDFENRVQYADAMSYQVSDNAGIPTQYLVSQPVTNSSQQLRFGAAYRLDKRFTLRAGWQLNDLSNPGDSNIPSLGFSIHLPFDKFSPSIDYAFIREPNGLTFMHVFALRLIL